MIDQKSVEKMILALPGVRKDYTFEKSLAVFSIDDNMFALLEEGTSPLRISLRCDPKLAELLRQKYESVMPAHKLDKRFWNSVILSGQLPLDELEGLVRHAYEVAKAL